MGILSFFDQFPEYNGVQFHFRGSDGYCKVSCLNQAMGGKRFTDWMKTKFAKTVVGELSRQTGIPIKTEGVGEMGEKKCAPMKTLSLQAFQ